MRSIKTNYICLYVLFYFYVKHKNKLAFYFLHHSLDYENYYSFWFDIKRKIWSSVNIYMHVESAYIMHKLQIS